MPLATKPRRGRPCVRLFSDADRLDAAAKLEPEWQREGERNGLALEAKFPAIAKAVSRLKLRSTILDGEVVAVDEDRIPPISVASKIPEATYSSDSLLSENDMIGHQTPQAYAVCFGI